MTTHYASLRLEELDPRIVPTATAVDTTVPVAAPPLVSFVAMMQPAQSQNALAGQGQGSYVRQLVPGAAGGKYQLQGTASLGELGQVSVKGFVQSAGILGHGHTSGSLTLTNCARLGDPETSRTATDKPVRDTQ